MEFVCTVIATVGAAGRTCLVQLGLLCSIHLSAQIFERSTRFRYEAQCDILSITLSNNVDIGMDLMTRNIYLFPKLFN